MRNPRSVMTMIEKLWGAISRLKERVDIIEPRESVMSGEGHIMVFDTYTEKPERNNESDVHGGLLILATAQALAKGGIDIDITKGIGKVLIVAKAGTDFDGEITITGDSIDRDTGVKTVGDTDTITVDTLSTDNTFTDANGNVVEIFIDAYITSKWFTGAVTLSTADLILSDVDVYHVSFEQANDQSNLILRTFDANIYTTDTNAEFDAYLHTLHITGPNKCKVDNESELHVGTVGETAIADRYWRLRKGNINEDLDGRTDGFWVNVRYANNPTYVEDVTIKVWVTKT